MMMILMKHPVGCNLLIRTECPDSPQGGRTIGTNLLTGTRVGADLPPMAGDSQVGTDSPVVTDFRMKTGIGTTARMRAGMILKTGEVSHLEIGHLTGEGVTADTGLTPEIEVLTIEPGTPPEIHNIESAIVAHIKQKE